MLMTPEIKALIDERKKNFMGITEGETEVRLDLLVAIAKKNIDCPDCGNEYIGDGEGTLEVSDTTYKRTCKCGWCHEEKVEGMER